MLNDITQSAISIVRLISGEVTAHKIFPNKTRESKGIMGAVGVFPSVQITCIFTL